MARNAPTTLSRSTEKLLAALSHGGRCSVPLPSPPLSGPSGSLAAMVGVEAPAAGVSPSSWVTAVSSSPPLPLLSIPTEVARLPAAAASAAMPPPSAPRLRFVVELTPGETTVGSWRRLVGSVRGGEADVRPVGADPPLATITSPSPTIPGAGKMSIVPKETIEAIAQSIGIAALAPNVAAVLAPDLEYRLREIVQEAIKCLRHSKRTVLTAQDVDSALSLRNIEPIYGAASGDPLRFKKALGHKDLFYVDDKELDFKDILEAPLPKALLDTDVVAHWLAIEGVQPAIPENAPVEALVAPSENKSERGKDEALPFDIKLPVRHVLSRELQLFFDKVTELAVSKSESVLFKEALVSLATDSGLHPLVPYFSYFVSDEVARSLSSFAEVPYLFALMRIVRSLLRNPHIHIEPYLHQLMPSVISCMVTKKLGHKLADDHWELRNFSANLAAEVCARFGHMYHNLQSRLTKTLTRTFLDTTKSLTQHYGAIRGLAALGPNVVRLLILPSLESYVKLLEPEMLLEKQTNEMKRKEAWRVYGTLMSAAGGCLYVRLKLFHGLSSPPARWRTNGRVATTLTNKRNSSSNHSSQQPPLKKLATDGSASSMLPISVTSGSSGIGPSGRPDKVANESTSSEIVREKSRAREPKMSAALAQAWRDDVDAGPLFASLFEIFGDGMFSFTQTAEMSFFL